MKIIFFSFLLSFAQFSQAAFDENGRRYASGNEVLWLLQQYFTFQLYTPCNRVTAADESSLGGNFLTTGQPISPSPNQMTIQFVMQCINEGTQTRYTFAANSDGIKRLLGPKIIQNLNILDNKWGTLSAPDRRIMIETMVHEVLGPNESIVEFGLILDPILYIDILSNEADSRKDSTVLEVVRYLLINLMTRDEFLSY